MRGAKYSLLMVLPALVVTQFLMSFGASRGQSPSKYVPVTQYDPKRNADQDIQEAMAEAKRTKRRILLEVGGEWCSWCHRLDEFFTAHPELIALRDKNYVTVKINFSEENPNKEVLSRYDKIPGYPHIFVLDSDGKLLHSQNTSPLESGKSYDLERITAFLHDWAPSQKD